MIWRQTTPSFSPMQRLRVTQVTINNYEKNCIGSDASAALRLQKK